MEGRMRDVGVWKIVRFSGIVAGVTLMLGGGVSCIDAPPAAALGLPLLGAVQAVATDATTTLHTVIALPQKTTSSPMPIAPASSIATPSAVSQPTVAPAKSSPTSTPAVSPSSNTAGAAPSVPTQPTTTYGYEDEMFNDSLTQPFVLADVARWPYAPGFTSNLAAAPATVHTAPIEATPEGWRIGGVLWYWWIGLLGIIAVVIHERAHFSSWHLKYKV